MAGPEIKEAADAFQDNKINQTEAMKIADAIDPAKTKPTDIQEFVKDSKTYPAFLDTIINNIDNYTQGNVVQIGPTLPGKLQIEENKVPLKNLTPQEKEKIMSDAKNFLLRLKDEKRKLTNNKNTQPVATEETVKKGADKDKENKEIPYDADKPLDSMLKAIDDKLPADKKMNQSAETIRTNLRNGILGQIQTELGSALRIKDKKLNDGNDNNRELLYKNLLENFTEQLTDKRLNNLVLGGMYVTINGIKQKMDQPNKNNLQNAHDFNIVGVNILSSIKDINSLLSANGNIMENLFKNSQDNIVKKIKDKFPREKIMTMNNNEFKNYLNDTKTNGFLVTQGKETNVVADIFKDTIKIDTEIDAINFIESNNGLAKSTPEQVGKDGAEIQKNLTKKIQDILGEVPTTPHEKEAFKTELIQNKFSGWSKSLLETIYTLAQKRGLGDLLNMFNKDGLFDKVLLSKSRNDALIAKKLYVDGKGKEGSKLSVVDAPADLNTIMGAVDINSVFKTLNDCKKFISPVTSDGGKETDDKVRSDKFMTDGKYEEKKVKDVFNIYVKELGVGRNTKISRPIEKDKVKSTKEYTYKDLIKNDADLVENFMQYVQTGQLPNGYADKKIYENMKDLGTEPGVIDVSKIDIKDKKVGINKADMKTPDISTFVDIPAGSPANTLKWKDEINPAAGKLNGVITVDFGNGITKDVAVSATIIETVAPPAAPNTVKPKTVNKPVTKAKPKNTK